MTIVFLSFGTKTCPERRAGYHTNIPPTLVFSSPTPLVGFYNIAPSQHQPHSGVTPSPSVPALPLLSAPPRCFFCTPSPLLLCNIIFSCASSFRPHHNLPFASFPWQQVPLFHPLARSLWSLGCPPPSLPMFLCTRLIFPAPKKLLT